VGADPQQGVLQTFDVVYPDDVAVSTAPGHIGEVNV